MPTSKTVDNWTGKDKLDRKVCADFLTNYLTRRYAMARTTGRTDTLVLNIRANWGFGKTFFIDCWMKDLLQNQYPVVHFDAWANDFSEDPLIGFIAAMEEALSEKYKKVPALKRHVVRVISVGRRLVKPIGIGIAGVLAKQLSGFTLEKFEEMYSGGNSSGSSEGDSDLKDDVGSVVAKVAEDAIAAHQSRKETIAEFKKRLAKLVEALEHSSGVQLPMFIFIDELDRCRPLYAIELLEAIKHLFGVHGIYFIVSTNLEQLGYSIRAVYGDRFHAEQYLKRFFDLEYLLPDPDHAQYAALLFERYGLDQFKGCYTAIDDGLYGGSSTAQVLFTQFSDAFDLSLRCQDQVASALQGVLLSWPDGEKIHFPLLLFFVVAKQKEAAFYAKLGGRELSYQDFHAALRAQIKDPEATIKLNHSSYRERNELDDDGSRKIVELIYFYYSLQHTTMKALLSKDNRNVLSFPGSIERVILESAGRMTHAERDKKLALPDYHDRVSRAGQLKGLAVE